MLKFPSQEGVEIYPSASGQICFKQQSIETGKQATICITIGQLRSLIKNAPDLITEANANKKEWSGE